MPAMQYTDKFDGIGIPWGIASIYADAFDGKYFVVKVGGDIIDKYNPGDENNTITVPEDLVLMDELGINIIAVHGGKGGINRALGKKSEFIEGQRVTEPDDMDDIEKAMRKVNHEFCGQIEAAGGNASSYERSLWARQYSDVHGLTGRPTVFISFPLASMTKEVLWWFPLWGPGRMIIIQVQTSMLTQQQALLQAR